jgi:hypothetical protein
MDRVPAITQEIETFSQPPSPIEQAVTTQGPYNNLQVEYGRNEDINEEADKSF